MTNIYISLPLVKFLNQAFDKYFLINQIDKRKLPENLRSVPFTKLKSGQTSLERGLEYANLIHTSQGKFEKLAKLILSDRGCRLLDAEIAKVNSLVNRFGGYRNICSDSHKIKTFVSELESINFSIDDLESELIIPKNEISEIANIKTEDQELHNVNVKSSETDEGGYHGVDLKLELKKWNRPSIS